jgi:cellobiose-specific phosphotransferase system component IIA
VTEEKQLLNRYLLGELSEAEQTSLEADYFSDPELFERLVGIENELVDGYARGSLPTAVRKRFEEHYLAHPDRQERARFAIALAAKLDQQSVVEQGTTANRSLWSQLKALFISHRSALAYVTAVGCLVLLVGAVWLIVQTRKLRQELAQGQIIRTEQEERERDLERLLKEQARDKERDQQNATPQLSPSPTSTSSLPTAHSVQLALVIGGARGPGNLSVPTLVIHADTQEVHLRVTMKEVDYVSYQAVLQPVGGDPVFTRKALRAVRNRSGARLNLSLSPSLLSSGDYMLTLKGVATNGETEEVSQSLFRVVKK